MLFQYWRTNANRVSTLIISHLCCLPLFRHSATQLDVGGRGRRFPLVHGDLARFLTLDDDGDGSALQTAVGVTGRSSAGASASAGVAFSVAPSPSPSSSSFPVPAPVSKRARAAASVLRAMNEHPATTGGGDDNMFAAHPHSHSNTSAASVSTVSAAGSDANDASDPSEANDDADADADEDESSDGSVSSSSSSSSLSSSHVEHIYGCARTHELLIRIALDHDRSYPAAMRLLGRARAAGHRLRYRTAVNS
jgi:hypothetical protein